MTILDLMRRTAARDPMGHAVHFESRRLTFADLEGGSNAAARVYRAHGVKEGDRVALFAGTSLEYVLAYLGILKLGGTAVPVNAHYKAAELARILTDSEPAVLVADTPRLAIAAAAATSGVHALLEIERGAGDRPAGGPAVFPFYQAVRKASVHPVDAIVNDEDLALLLYTSGTTGVPKGAMLTHANLTHNATAIVDRFRWTPEDRFLHVLPLFHVHGLCVGLHGTLVAGGDTRLVERFDAVETLRLLEAERATLFMGVPTMYGRLLAAAAARPTKLPAIRLCVSGSAPLAPHVARAFEERFGARILERYGMTETLITIAQEYDGPRTPGTVGTPLSGVEARIVDSDLNDVRAGQEGELVIRGPCVGPGYWKNDAATDAAFADGWFLTGDIARRDDDGVYSIVGRAKEMILSGGFNVYPREVEDVLLTHPAVVEAAVFGVDDADLGEAVAAAVVLRDGAAVDETALIEHCRERLASFKKPRTIRFVAELPRNAMEKVERRSLKDG